MEAALHLVGGEIFQSPLDLSFGHLKKPETVQGDSQQ
jgi:hypothetical protein